MYAEGKKPSLGSKKTVRSIVPGRIALPWRYFIIVWGFPLLRRPGSQIAFVVGSTNSSSLQTNFSTLGFDNFGQSWYEEYEYKTEEIFKSAFSQ
jgi:hypothetical protein